MTVSARRAATRARIIDAAVEVFSERGVQAASVEEICDKAGFTRGAFYSNFESKVDICAAILDIQSERAAAAASRAVGSLEGLEADLSSLVSAAVTVFLEAMASTPGMVLAQSEMRLWAAREPELRPAFARLEESSYPVFEELITKGLSRHHGRLRVPVRDAIDLLRAIHDYSAIDQMRSSSQLDAAQTGRMMSAVLSGLIVSADDQTVR